MHFVYGLLYADTMFESECIEVLIVHHYKCQNCIVFCMRPLYLVEKVSYSNPRLVMKQAMNCEAISPNIWIFYGPQVYFIENCSVWYLL